MLDKVSRRTQINLKIQNNFTSCKMQSEKYITKKREGERKKEGKGVEYYVDKRQDKDDTEMGRKDLVSEHWCLFLIIGSSSSKPDHVSN